MQFNIKFFQSNLAVVENKDFQKKNILKKLRKKLPAILEKTLS